MWLSLWLLLLPAGRCAWAGAQAPEAPGHLLSQAQRLYEQRGDLQKARRAAGLYRRVLEQNPRNEQAALRLASLYVWLGVHQKERDQELAYYQRAVKVASRAVKLYPDHPGPHYWLGVAYGLMADTCNFLRALEFIQPLKKQMKRLMELDPSYEYGGPYRVLGRLYTKLPALMGGDLDLAERYLRKAVSLGPGYWLNHLYLAAVLLEKGKEKEARALVARVRDGGLLQGLEPESRFWKKSAARLLRDRQFRRMKAQVEAER